MTFKNTYTHTSTFIDMSKQRDRNQVETRKITYAKRLSEYGDKLLAVTISNSPYYHYVT